MNWLIENWTLLVAVIAVAIVGVWYAKKFLALPTEDQIKAVKEWLLFAVATAEKEFGGGTGKLKLRAVYAAFVEKFPWIAKAVSFEVFSVWVDDALLELRRLLDCNQAIQSYVSNK